MSKRGTGGASVRVSERSVEEHGPTATAVVEEPGAAVPLATRPMMRPIIDLDARDP